MNGSQFFESNVIIYAYDSLEPRKQAIAQTCLATSVHQGDGIVSVQVFGEFFHAMVIRRKIMAAIEAGEVLLALEAGFEVREITPHLVQAAIGIHK